MRYLNFESLAQVETLTLYEYQLLMKAYQLRRIDQEYDMHLQAWLHVQAGATKETGGKTRPVYDRFNKFYDYKKRLRELEKMESHKLKPTYARMATAASMANQGREG